MGWMAEVGMGIFQENVLTKLNKEIEDRRVEYRLNPSVAKEQFLAGLIAAREIVKKESIG